jgi:hypothetical protein
MVKEHGFTPGKYVFMMVIFWIGLELLGAMIGMAVFGERMAAYPLGLLGAAIGAFISYQIAKSASPRLADSNDLLDSNVV